MFLIKVSRYTTLHSTFENRYFIKWNLFLDCATVVNLWSLPVWRSSFSHGKNFKEYVIGGRKNQTFDSLDLFDARFFSRSMTILGKISTNYSNILNINTTKLFFMCISEKKNILRKSFTSIKLFISLTTDTVSIWPISVLGWVFSDIVDSRNCRKNWILTW